MKAALSACENAPPVNEGFWSENEVEDRSENEDRFENDDLSEQDDLSENGDLS